MLMPSLLRAPGLVRWRPTATPDTLPLDEAVIASDLLPDQAVTIPFENNKQMQNKHPVHLLISHQPIVLFSQNKPATSNQSALLFSQNKPAPAISHQRNEQAEKIKHDFPLSNSAHFCCRLGQFPLQILNMISPLQEHRHCPFASLVVCLSVLFIYLINCLLYEQ
jgi:hypothetical protein